MYDVITIGAATRDVFLESKKISPHKDVHYRGGNAICFDMDSKNEIDSIILSTGGGATNAAASFARQGLKSACIVRVGSDEIADDILKSLKKEKISLEFIQKDKKPATGYSTIITATDGSRVVLVKRGVSSDIKFSEIDLNKLKKTKWVYISSLGGNLALLSKILSFTQKNGIKTAWNPGGNELSAGLKKLTPFLKKVNIFMVNLEEAADLMQMPIEQEEKIFKGLDKLVKEVTVMTKGPEGVSVFDGKDIYCAGVPKSEVIDRTGAGDAFGSGFVSALIMKKDIPFAVQLATANSTSVVAYYSAKTGLLKKGEWGKWPKVKVSKDVCY